MADLTISIVTINNGGLLKDCLNSIYKNTKNISMEIYVIDNASTDGTREMITDNFPDVKVISLSKIDSFSGNHNRVLKIARGKNIVILNNDTIIKEGAFEKMHYYINRNNNVGIIGPRIISRDGSYQQSAFKFPNLRNFLWDVFFYRVNPEKSPAFYDGIKDITEAKDIDWLLGACLLIPGHIVKKVGLFDEYFSPVYMEDADMCKRVKDAGYRVVYYPEAEIIHHGSQTIKRQKALADRILIENRIRFFRKHYGIFYCFLARCILICAVLLNGIIKILKR